MEATRGTLYKSIFRQALIKVYSRGERTILSVAEELSVNCHSVKIWIKRTRMCTGWLVVDQRASPAELVDWTVVAGVALSRFRYCWFKLCE